MSLTRTVPASPGYSELHTAAENAGCGSQKKVAREISAGTRSLCPNKPFKTKPLLHFC
jgi:hypothetical protein